MCQHKVKRNYYCFISQVGVIFIVMLLRHTKLRETAF